MTTNIHKRIFAIQTADAFNDLALELFRYQVQHCAVYKDYCAHLRIDASQILHHSEIPFLPISFFRSHEVLSDEKQASIVFESSSTTSNYSSRHFIADEALYNTSFMQCFEAAYGSIKDWHILALLPSYLEKGNSSLVYMCDALIKASDSNYSSFYLHDTQKLHDVLALIQKDSSRKTMLIGVTYALLDFAEAYPQDLSNIVILETGGMKGRRKELTRAALHEQLKTAFQVSAIHSEYGMTELLSQAYSTGDGLYKSPAWMKVIITDMYDPLSLQPVVETGRVNVIDLANLYSCCFIATSDIGKMHASGEFEILGRMDHAALRGCNLMVE